MAYENTRNDGVTHTIGRIIDDVRELLREEVALAKAELRQEVGEFGSAVARIGAGSGAAVFALGFLLLGAAQGFADLVNWPAWGGYLAMALVLGVFGAVAIITGRTRAKQVPALPRTTETLKETKEWMTNRASSNSK